MGAAGEVERRASSDGRRFQIEAWCFQKVKGKMTVSISSCRLLYITMGHHKNFCCLCLIWKTPLEEEREFGFLLFIFLALCFFLISLHEKKEFECCFFLLFLFFIFSFFLLILYYNVIMDSKKEKKENCVSYVPYLYVFGIPSHCLS